MADTARAAADLMRRYTRAFARAMAPLPQLRRRTRRDMRASLEEFLARSPAAGWDEVVEAFGTVVAEAVVVTRYQAAHIKAVAQHVLHEVVCRERSHLPVEVEHLAAVNARGGYQPALLFAGGEQARLELLVQHKARMSVEGDYRRLQSKLRGTVDYALYEELVPTVYTVEKAYRGYARGCAMRCVHD